MDNSLAQKLSRLTGILLSLPGAPRRPAHLPGWGRSPIDLERRCFTYGVTDFLRGAVQSGHTVKIDLAWHTWIDVRAEQIDFAAPAPAAAT